MKIRIYAVLPDTEEGQQTSVSSALKCTEAEIPTIVSGVIMLYPDWSEITIERITSPD